MMSGYKLTMRAALISLLPFLLAILACQSGQSTYTIGVISQTSALADVLDGFKEGMFDLGYVEQQDVVYIYNGPTDFEELATESQRLLEQSVDLILALGTPAAIEAKRAVQGMDVPVIFAPVYDPVKSGLVQELRQPGGNVTGVRSGGRIAKILELHLEIAPDTSRIFVPHNPADNASVQSLAELRRESSALGIDLVVVEVATDTELSTAFREMPLDVDSIFLLTSGFLIRNSDRFMEAAIANMLPISSASSGTQSGLLLAYQSDQNEIGRQVSLMANKILLGTSPADLPVESSKPKLGVNLLTAKAINIQIPDFVLQLAEVVVR